ncbi:Right origin-binding protein [Serratia rubidaea]|uniref:Right origin-binding protein n=1 Tax=Serratia rubidaea TaxID=61652 RepID=A0A4U9HC58_SERRU|nr:Right origin-binding protein [Serratia rubidaea]
MDRANIIHDLLNWIETHLDQPLLLDNVAAKSGYSKWHLQRMFRSTTGPRPWQLYPRTPAVESRSGAEIDAAPDPGYRPAISF